MTKQSNAPRVTVKLTANECSVIHDLLMFVDHIEHLAKSEQKQFIDIMTWARQLGLANTRTRIKQAMYRADAIETALPKNVDTHPQ